MWKRLASRATSRTGASPAVSSQAGASAATRSPAIVASMTGGPLTKEPMWIECDLVPGRSYRVRALIDGAEGTEDKGALLRVDMQAPGTAPGQGLSVSNSVGAFTYLRTGEGLHRSDKFFGVARPVHRVGVQAWGNKGSVNLRTFTLEELDDRNVAADFFFSFDVEAPPSRAAGDPIDTLVWGKVGGGEYGIRRICDVLEQYRIKGNFLIDFASCTRDDERQLRAMVDMLAGRGHEIHMHLHTSDLARRWRLHTETIRLDKTSYAMQRRLLEYTMQTYQQFVGSEPRVFRSGSYSFNPALVLAAGTLGIECLSNVRGDVLTDIAAGGDVVSDREPFRWENGVLELPVDASSPEAGTFDNYVRRYEAAVRRKTVERTWNVVMHSWSLIRRSERGLHETFEPEYERRLHRMCEHASRHGKAYGYSEYLDSHRMPRPTVNLARLRNAEPEELVHLPAANSMTCTVCDMVMLRSATSSDVCLGCGLDSPYRQLRYVLDTYGDVLTGRNVVACDLSVTARNAFLRQAASVVNIGTDLGFDRGLAQTADSLSSLANGSAQCVVGIDLLDRMAKDPALTGDVARVLQKGGVLVSAGLPDGSDDAEALLAQDFTASSISGFDPMSGNWGPICLAYRR